MEMAESKRWQSYGDGRVKEIAELRRDGRVMEMAVMEMAALGRW